MKSLLTTFVIFISCALYNCSVSQGSIVVTPLGGTNYQVTLDPVTFHNISAPNGGMLTGVVIEDFFASNAVFTGVAVSGFGTYSVNGGPNENANISGANGTLGITFNELDPNDLFIQTVAFGSLSGGEDITFSTFNAVFTSGFVPAQNLPGPYTISLVDFTNYNAVASATVSGVVVPEPGMGIVYGVVALAGSIGLRRKKR